MSTETTARSRLEDHRCSPIPLSKTRGRKPGLATPEAMEANRRAFEALPDIDDFLLRMSNAMMNAEIEHAVTILRDFYVRMHPPELTPNTPVAALPLETRVINALESSGFMKVSALLPLSEEQLIAACQHTSNCFGIGAAAAVSKALEPLRGAYERSKRTGLYDDLDEELMDEVEADKSFRR